MDVSLKYNMNDFYVGELYIGEKVGNLLAGASAFSDYESKRQKRVLEYNGAIDFTSRDVWSYRMDPDSRLIYTGFLCLFYKYHNEYLCLEDFKLYNEVGKDFYKNLVPLSSLLPKVDYEIPNNISVKEGLKLFDKLFKDPEQFYKKAPHEKLEFYVGSLYKCNEIATSRYDIERINLPQEFLLRSSDARFTSGSSINCAYDNNEPKYNYSTYSCLFLKHPLGVLNLNNHQIYTNGVMKMEHLRIVKGQDHYEWITTLNDYLEDNKVRDYHNLINIPGALKLVKKANNKR